MENQGVGAMCVWNKTKNEMGIFVVRKCLDMPGDAWNGLNSRTWNGFYSSSSPAANDPVGLNPCLFSALYFS